MKINIKDLKSWFKKLLKQKGLSYKEKMVSYEKEFNALHEKKALKEIGLTDHEDLGVVDGKYCDKVWDDNRWIIIRVDAKKIDMAENPQLARCKNLEREIKFNGFLECY